MKTQLKTHKLGQNLVSSQFEVAEPPKKDLKQTFCNKKTDLDNQNANWMPYIPVYKRMSSSGLYANKNSHSQSLLVERFEGLIIDFRI